MDQKPFARGVFPLSLTKTIRLISSLIYLQLLYAISHIAKPFWNFGRDFPPFIKNIDKTETSIINAIFGVTPLTPYSSTTATERQWRLSSGNDLLNHTESILVVPQRTASTGLASSGPQMAQQHPEPSSNRDIQKEHENAAPPITGHSRMGSSIYENMQNIKSSTRGSISTIASSAKAIFHQPGTSQPLSPVLRNLDDSSSSDKIPEQVHPGLHQEPVKLVSVSQRLTENMSSTAPISSFAPARPVDHASDPGPSSAVKGKGKVKEAALFGATVGSAVDSETMQMNRSRKYHSIESYPGKFPFSDALDYSSLASAFAVRGRGTTSVRPFSDY
jgi:hypothetical protein